MNDVSHRETPVFSRAATSTDPRARRVLIAASLHAGSRGKRAPLTEIAERLTAAGYDVETTCEVDVLTALATRWRDQGDLRAVLVGGGDGTASLVRSRVPLNVPVVPLPLGTENLLARYVSQSGDPAAVCRTLREGVTIGLDLGRAGGRLFLLMISVGFDAEVVRRLHESRRGHITRLSYLKPTLQTIRSYVYPELRLYCWGHEPEPRTAGAEGGGTGTVDPQQVARPESSDGRGDCEPRPSPSVRACHPDGPYHSCRWLFGFNLPAYACRWQLTPDAVGTDGQLDVCTFQRGSLAGGLRYLWHVVRGNHLQLTDAHLVRCRRFRVEAADGSDVAYQLDGDLGGVLPVDVEVLPGECRLLVARDVAERLGFSLPAGEPAAAADNDADNSE